MSWILGIRASHTLLASASASTVGGTVDLFFVVLTLLSVAMLAALGIGILYFLIRYRKGSNADRSPPRSQGLRLEIAWIVATTIVFLAIGVWGSYAYVRMAKPPAGESLEIYAIGRQWMWEIAHPSGRREHNRLHVPLGQTVRLNLLSEDVIHSFYMPAFRLKHDVMPNKVTSLWFEATRTGSYPLFCAEFCGTEHHRMVGEVIVMEPSDYAIWAKEGDASETLAAKGAQLFMAYGCSGCHSPNSRIHAPDLEGVYGRLVALDDGGFARADEAYLHDSIMLPNKQVAAGYEPIMPTYQDAMPTADAFALVEYIKSLASEPPRRETPQP